MASHCLEFMSFFWVRSVDVTLNFREYFSVEFQLSLFWTRLWWRVLSTPCGQTLFVQAHSLQLAKSPLAPKLLLALGLCDLKALHQIDNRAICRAYHPLLINNELLKYFFSSEEERLYDLISNKVKTRDEPWVVPIVCAQLWLIMLYRLGKTRANTFVGPREFFAF